MAPGIDRPVSGPLAGRPERHGTDDDTGDDALPKSGNRRKDGSVHSGRKAPDDGTDRTTAAFGLQGGQGMQDGGPAGFESTASGAGQTAGAPGAGGPSAGGQAGPTGGGSGLGAGFGGATAAGPSSPIGGSPFNQQQQAAIDAAAQKVGLFGNVVWLMMQSAAHKHLFLTDMEWLVMPALQLNQFRLWQQNGMPVAYASWAFLDAAAEVG